MTQINDQILQELGVDLGTNKIPPVANLVDSLAPTIDTWPYRRKLIVASDGITPGGVSATDFFVEYFSPKSHGIEWFAASFGAAAVDLIMFLQVQVLSAKGQQTVSVGRILLESSTQTPFIGNMHRSLVIPVDANNNTWEPSKVYVPALGKLIFTVGREQGGILPNAALAWTLFGWSVPNPRGDPIVLPTDNTPVAP